LNSDKIAIFEFTIQSAEVKLKEERHYHLVPPSDISESEIAGYNQM
jgi:hypothetical protein